MDYNLRHNTYRNLHRLNRVVDGERNVRTVTLATPKTSHHLCILRSCPQNPINYHSKKGHCE